MKNIYISLLTALALAASSCKGPNYVVTTRANLTDIENSTHTQLYRAMQDLNLHQGITLVPQKIDISCDHTLTQTGSLGITIFKIFGPSYQIQLIKDNPRVFSLAPPKLSGQGMQLAAFRERLPTNPNTCAFEYDRPNTDRNSALLSPDAIETENKKIAKENASVEEIKHQVEADAANFTTTPNFGLLSVHQVNSGLKFTFSTDGAISVGPVANFVGLQAKYDRKVESTDEIQFTFNIVQNNAFYYNTRQPFAAMREETISRHGGICSYFTVHNYEHANASKFLTSPPAANQMNFSSCVAYAVGYIGLSTALHAGSDQGFNADNEYSPDFLFARLTDNKCDGLDVPTALDEVVKQGDPTVRDFPIIENLVCSTYNDDGHRAQIRAAIPHAQQIRNRVQNGWLLLDPNNIDQIRLCLDNNEPVIVAFYVTSSFTNMWRYGNQDYNGENVWSTMDGPPSDAHCVCIIGYDNGRHMFKVQNSWGMSNFPSHDGFFWVTYDMVKQGCFNQAYSFIPNVPD